MTHGWMSWRVMLNCHTKSNAHGRGVGKFSAHESGKPEYVDDLLASLKSVRSVDRNHHGDGASMAGDRLRPVS